MGNSIRNSNREVNKRVLEIGNEHPQLTKVITTNDESGGWRDAVRSDLYAGNSNVVLRVVVRDEQRDKNTRWGMGRCGSLGCIRWILTYNNPYPPLKPLIERIIRVVKNSYYNININKTTRVGFMGNMVNRENKVKQTDGQTNITKQGRIQVENSGEGERWAVRWCFYAGFLNIVLR